MSGSRTDELMIDSRETPSRRARWRRAAAAIALAAVTAHADAGSVSYEISLPAPQTQMVEMTLHVDEVDGATLDLALPTWRPGYYSIIDPAGSVREVRAFDDRDRPLAIEKVRKSAWRITTGGAETVRVAYRVYCNSLDDRTRHVDDTHAFLSGSSVFLYPPKRRDDPITVSITAPAHWRVATGLEPVPGARRTFEAASYDVLVDSPFEIGVHDLLEFDVDGVPHEIAIWGDAEYDAETLERDFATIVRAQTAVFGMTPYERYVFLVHVAPGIGGGTEHLNSTIMQTRPGTFDDEDRYERFLGLVSHEMFHTWNVKQLRPAGLAPYDYDRENYTSLLWVAEGTTSYYDDLAAPEKWWRWSKAWWRTVPELPPRVVLILVHVLCSTAAGEGDPDRGRQIYEQGIGTGQTAIVARMGTPAVEVPARAMPCAGCHGIDGRGRAEGGLEPADITWSSLTRPTR